MAAPMDSQYFPVCVSIITTYPALPEGDVMGPTVGRQWIRFDRVLRISGDQRANKAIWSHIMQTRR